MIFWFYGTNSYAARQQIAKMADQYRAKVGSDIGLERINGAEAAEAALAAALQAAPFLTSSRLVIIEDLGQNKAVAPKIGLLLAGVPDTTVAVLYDGKLDKRGQYYKELSASTLVKAVGFDPLPEAKLLQWIEREAARRGLAVTRPVAVKLLRMAGDDQWRLSAEIAKLAAYGGDITTELLEDMVSPNPSDTIFDLVEAMTAGRTEQALGLYRSLRADQQSEYYILTMIIWQLRNLVLAKAGAGLSAAELSKTTGLSSFVAGKMLTRQRSFDAARLQQVFISAVDTDYRIKSGFAKADVLVEQLVVHIARQSTSLPSR